MAKRISSEVKQSLRQDAPLDGEPLSFEMKMAERERFRVWEKFLSGVINERFKQNRKQNLKYLQKLADCLLDEEFKELANQLKVKLPEK